MDHTRDRQFSFERLDLWHLALDAIGAAHEIADKLGRPHSALADQLRRASSSIGANIAEGVGKDGADQLRFFGIARGSTYETAAIVEMAARIGRVTPEQRCRSASRCSRSPRSSPRCSCADDQVQDQNQNQDQDQNQNQDRNQDQVTAPEPRP